MATITVTATPEPGFSPPRVRIDILDTGNAPAIASVTVTRTVNGETVAVRSNDGNPLQLVPASADTRTGVIYDYELPFEANAVYSTLQQADNVSGSIFIEADDPWLVHPGVPSLSRPVSLRVGSFQSRKRAAQSGVFYPMNRSTAVVVTDGRRKAPESTFTVATDTPEEAQAIADLIDDAGILFMNIPPHLGLMLKSMYVAVLDVNEDRPSDVGEDTQRDWVMPYVEVARPTGGTPTSWTWADVMATYATWQDVLDANVTWADLLEPLG